MHILKLLKPTIKNHKLDSFDILCGIHIFLFFCFVPEQLQRSKPSLIADQSLSESDGKNQIIFTDYVISGETIGELNCLTNEPMNYSAICKTVVEVRKHHLCLTVVSC